MALIGIDSQSVRSIRLNMNMSVFCVWIRNLKAKSKTFLLKAVTATGRGYFGNQTTP
jgi:hypothetical protein